MPSRSHILSLFAAALLASAQALAVPFPDEFVGPPSYSLMGCPHDKVWTKEVVKASTGFSDKLLERFKNRFHYSPEMICGAEPRTIAVMMHVTDATKHRFDQPDKWMEQRAMQMRDENGTIPNNALMGALTQRQQLLLPPGYATLMEGGETVVAAPTVAGLASSSWTSLGPGNIGGRVRAISPSPTTPGDILIGSVSGGIWRTTNGGTTWSVMDDFMPSVAVTCLVRDPAAPSTVYACTGEGQFPTDAIRGLGIFKSTNSGTSWSQLSSTDPGSTGNTDWNYVNRIAISPTNSLVMLAATNQGLYRSTNGGSSWTKVYEAVGTGRWRNVSDVAFHPTNGNIAVLGEAQHLNCLSTCFVDGAGVAYSSDGGATWTRSRLTATTLSGSLGRVQVAISKSNPSIVYALLDLNNGEVYKSADGGLTWGAAPVGNTAVVPSQGWYNLALWVAPNDSNRLIAGGVTVKFSTNGGSTWASIATNTHADHHIFVSDPNYTSNFTVYGGSDGGVFKAVNVNTTPSWSNLNNGLAITQLYGIGGKAGGRIVAGAQDTGTMLWTGSQNWVSIWGGDGGNSAADQVDGNYVYGMTQYGAVIRYNQALASNPPANSSEYICTGIADISCSTTPGGRVLFIPPLELDTSSNTTLYLGAERLWRSTNIKLATASSVSWTAIKGVLTSGVYISAISVAPGNPDIVWIGYQNGKLSCTTNATATTPAWTEVSGGAARYVSRITFDPTNTNRVFVANTGFSNTNLRYTTMGCTATPTWTVIHNTLPVAPIRAVAIHPNNPNWLYAGTEVGLFTSEDLGAHWSTTNDGPGTVSVEELVWLDSTTLLVGTHGRGAFKATVLPGGAPLFSSAPPAGGTVNVAYSHTYTASGTPAPTFSLTSGAFPTGLTLNSTTGVLSGTPSAAATYTGVVTASNTSGTATQSFSITIASGLPGAPTIGTATAGNGQATISFFAPNPGSSPITSYTVTCSPGGSASGAASPITVTGLTNGTTYTCSVTATNSSGTGPASGTVTVTPGAAPAFTSAAAPGGTFGTAYSHTFTASGSPAPTFSLSSGVLPGGLSLAAGGALTGTPNATGTFTGVVTATNSMGSATQGFSITIAATVPGAPTTVSATAGTGSATIVFGAPVSDGGSAVSGYAATCNPGAITVSGGGSPIVVSGLTGGVTYSCSVKAANAVGFGPASSSVSVVPTQAPAFTSGAFANGTYGVPYSFTVTASGSPAPTFSFVSGTLATGMQLNTTTGQIGGTPTATGTFTGTLRASNTAGTATQSFSFVISATVPGAPTITSATPGSGQATIAFSAPASNGGSPITGYTVTCNPGAITASGAASPIVVSGLANGAAYTCSMIAANSQGSSAASNSVNVTIAATAPGAPTIGSATPGNGQATVSFTPPANNGGSSITGYTATCNPGANAATGPGSPLTVGGLSNGTTYTCSVTATNASGTGPASGTVSVTPGVAPLITSALPGSGTVNSAYAHAYTASGSPAPTFALTSGSLPPGLSLAIGGGLTGTPTTAGTFGGTVTATNVIGTSSQAFSIAIAAVPPGAPTIGSATGGNTQASISFTPPAFTGGTSITSYRATCNPGNLSATGAASPIVVGGLANNFAYSCSVTATNSAGTGPASGTVSVTPTSGIPLALTGVLSRKTHGSFGTWDLAIDASQPIGGAVSVEPRAIGAGHKIIFVFNDTIASAGTAACVDAGAVPVGSVSAIALGNSVEVTLTGVPDNKRVSVSLSGVNGTSSVAASLGFLVGDVNNSRSVTSADILAVKGRDGQNVNAGNFRYDVNVSGNISLTDAVLTHGNAGLALP